jgi:hypothetical protein
MVVSGGHGVWKGRDNKLMEYVCRGGVMYMSCSRRGLRHHSVAEWLILGPRSPRVGKARQGNSGRAVVVL